MVALDWAKVFDSINVEALVVALRRFGVPPKLLRVVQHIYQDRSFRVADGSLQSSERRQMSGISQGCPLSPFLFVMVMTVVVSDSICQLGEEMRRQFESGSFSVVLYADDTLVIGDRESAIQEMLNAIADVGSRFGMALH